MFTLTGLYKLSNMANLSAFDCFTGSDRASKAIARIQAKKYDTDSWNMLIKEVSTKNIEDVEAFYEELLKTFPLCGRYWKTYIDHELKYKHYDKARELFKKSLEEVLSIELYKCYLNFVREFNAGKPELIYQAFRFTLGRVGIDPNAIGIYNDYIQFLLQKDIDDPYLDGQRKTTVRRAYQEGVKNPMFHIETLWTQYIAFERDNHRNIADSMVQNHSPDHMNARRVAKEWEVIIRGLNRSWPAVPPTFSNEEARQLEIWRRYIQWERSNPLRIEDNNLMIKRTTYAYKQYLLCFGHHPNVWHEYATYLEEQIKSLSDKEVDLKQRLLEELTTLFERGIKGLMKYNLLIHFAYADFEEIRNDKTKAAEIYKNLVEIGKENDHIDLTLVYIQWMRFTRRTEGLKAARSIFKRARDEKNIGHQIYTAAALMEYHCTKDQAIACKIFELGLKKFNDCPDFILSYIHFMNSLNEENNTRVLFERVLTTCSLSPKDAVEIWNSFLDFESGIGDLSSTLKVERRRNAALSEAFPKCSDTSWSVDKYKFQDLYPCSANELRSLGYSSQQSYTSLASVRNLLSSIDLSSEQSNLTQGISTTNNTSSKAGLIGSHKRKQISKSLNGQVSDLFDQNDGDTEFTLSALNQATSMCEPDLDQMLPFKPVMSAGFGSHTVPGGIFPPPPAIGSLLSKLPQPGSFWGPFVDIEELCNIVRGSDFDELFNNLVEQRRNEQKPRTKKARVE